MSQHKHIFRPFSFAVVADPHLNQGHGWRRLQTFIEQMRDGTDIAFVLALGDFICSEPETVKERFSSLPVPVHAVYGNGDIGPLAEYESCFGPRDNIFKYNNCVFALLFNAEKQSHTGDCSEAQWEWLEQQLEKAWVPKARHVFLAAHVPPACPNGYHPFYLRPEAEERFWKICKRYRIKTCFFGHLHQDEAFRRENTDIIVTPSLNWNFVLVKDVLKNGKIADDKSYMVIDEKDRVFRPLKQGEIPDSKCLRVEDGWYRIVRVGESAVRHSLFQLP